MNTRSSEHTDESFSRKNLEHHGEARGFKGTRRHVDTVGSEATCLTGGYL